MEQEPNAEDAEHLSALSIGHYIMAGLTLIGVAPMLLYAIAGAKIIEELGSDLSMAMGDVSGQTAVDPFAGTPAAMIEDIGSMIMTMTVLGIVVIVVTAIGFFLVGFKLRQRRWWTFCYLSGWGECLLFPFGTILGVFTIVVLSRPGVKRSFGMR